MIKPILLSTLAAFVAVSSPTHAVAQERQSAKVSYADLDLTTHAGRNRLNQRITSAVGRVCNDGNDRDLAIIMAIRACRREASANAQVQVLAAIQQRQQEFAVRSASAPVEIAHAR